MKFTKRQAIATLVALISTTAAPALGQTWPDGPVTMIVPWGPVAAPMPLPA